ncbi:hypothetical protein FB451DRAFT_1104474 [Mycena latifolia]|nr:hypothetical protein FB451DRAFT_1104474 [Mycena latifolia]
MKVLILGATGFIGLPAAQALVRAGHIVYGLARTPEKAKALAAEEIIPVIGTVDSDVWIPLISTLDVIIEVVGGMDVNTLASMSRTTLERVAKAAETLRPAGAPLLSYIYTSGTWSHGDNRTDIVTDTTPVARPVELVTWRPAMEQLVVRSTAVNGIVIRPALLYGRSGSILAPLFKIASEGRVVWPGTPGGRWAVIHADDLADMYVRLAEKAQIIGGKIFDAANPCTESVDELLQKLVAVSKAKGPYEYRKPANLFEEAVASTALVRPYLANALLGWSVKKPGLIEGLETYYAAWLASCS